MDKNCGKPFTEAQRNARFLGCMFDAIIILALVALIVFIAVKMVWPVIQ